MCGGEIAEKSDPNPAGEGSLTGRFVRDSTFESPHVRGRNSSRVFIWNNVSHHSVPESD